MKIEIKNKSFYKDGAKINIYSGAIHYFRILPEYWYDRLLKLKLAGFNTVETYIPWNLHEPKKGHFDFSYHLDLFRFLSIATSLDLMIILRPSPYICAEIDFGGLPSWLLKNNNIELRCYNKAYLKHVDDYYDSLLPKLAPYLACNGGNVIAMQIENEYGSYSNDKAYMNYLKNALIKRHMDVILFTSDGTLPSMIAGGSIKNTLAAMNFGSNAKNSFDLIKKINPDYPLFCGELWIGWFDQYYKEKKQRDVDSVITEINELFKIDASFNVYMFIGGTNFNFTAGANYFDKYYATTTSYDYNALLNEHGGYTPLYFAIREVLLKKQNLKSLPLPIDVKLQKIDDLKPSFYASLCDNYKKIAKKHYSKLPHNIEYYNQDYGYIIYEVKINDDYQATRLLIEDVNDIAYVYINNEFIVKFDSLNSKTNTHSFELGPLKKNSVIKIFVDCMGRINYGHKLKNTKGIKNVILGSQILTNFKVYCLDMKNLTNLEYKEFKSKNKLSYPCFIKYNFKATSNLDTYISILNLKKGFVKVNDFNIGRYYNVIPQEKIYLPGALLKKENEIIVFEEEKIKDLVLKFIDK